MLPDKTGDNIDPKSKVELVSRSIGNGVRGILTIHGREIAVPSFVLETAGADDFEILIRNTNLLKEPHMVAVTAYRWPEYAQSIPTVVDTELDRRSREFVSSNHIASYEPPEYYRYLMPRKLLFHAVRGDISKTKKFWKIVREEDDKKQALSLLPKFEREFIKDQWDTLLWQHFSQRKREDEESVKDWKVIPTQPEVKPDAEMAWGNVNESSVSHLADGLVECQEMKNSSSFIPGMRTLKAGSEKHVRNQVRNLNRATAFLWKSVLNGQAFPSGRPWFHLSLASSIFTKKGDVETGPDDVLGIVDESLVPGSHCGICITMTGWQYAWQEGKPRDRLEGFFTELKDVATDNKLPIYGARSKWIGIDLMDKGLTFAGTILNGNETISRSSGGIDSSDPRAYGTTPIYGECYEAGIVDLFEINSEIGNFQNPIELHRFDGIESRCDPSLQYDSTRYRKEFAKPRRIATHTQEVREIREAQDRGEFRPGREYVKRSKIWKGVPQ